MKGKSKVDDSPELQEPTFTIRASDFAAADTVRYWAERFRHQGALIPSDTDSSIEIYTAAYDIARAMDEWSKSHAKPK